MMYVHINRMPDNWSEKISEMGIYGKNILVIGYPGSGKSYIVDQIPKTPHTFIRTDDYINHGFEESIYRILDDIYISHEGNVNTFVEGVQGYRLLRKGLQTNTYYPDIIIEVRRDWGKIEELYRNERGIDKLKGAKGMVKSCDKILNEYLSMPNDRKPETWFIVHND